MRSGLPGKLRSATKRLSSRRSRTRRRDSREGMRSERAPCAESLRRRALEKDYVDDGICQRKVELNGGTRIDRHYVQGSEIGQIGQAGDKFPEGQLLDGNEIRFKRDAKMCAQGTAQAAGQGFVKLGNRKGLDEICATNRKRDLFKG